MSVFVEIFIFVFLFGIAAGGGCVVGERVTKKVWWALKEFKKGWDLPTAGPKLQKMIDEDEGINELTDELREEFAKNTPLEDQWGWEFPEPGMDKKKNG